MEPTPPELGANTGSPPELVVEASDQPDCAAGGERLVSAATTFPGALLTHPRSS
jgi:hypothetical protein